MSKKYETQGAFATRDLAVAYLKSLVKGVDYNIFEIVDYTDGTYSVLLG